jgi:hypothetical protein
MVRTRSTEFRWPTVSAGLLLVALEIYGFLGSLLLSLMRCDEGCTNDPHAPWRNTLGAWQWDALPILSGIAVLASVAGVVLALRRGARASSAAYGLSVGAMLVWTAIYATA